jgi:hypothetical protein
MITRMVMSNLRIILPSSQEVYQIYYPLIRTME